MGLRAVAHIRIRGVHGGPPLVALTTVDATRRPRKKSRGRNGMKAASRAYFADLARLVRQLFADIDSQIVSQIPRWTREEAELTNDAIDDELSFLIARLREQYSSPALLFQYEGAAEDAERRTERINGVQTQAQLKRLGIDIFRESPQLARLSRRFVARNTALITSIPQQTLGQVERVIEAGVQGGRRARDIARDITAVTTAKGTPSSEREKARNRAALIARDQTLTHSAQLSQARQQANGITKFVWRTVGDGRVRDLHDPREGKPYTWATGAGSEDPFPGSGVNCRCSSEPVI